MEVEFDAGDDLQLHGESVNGTADEKEQSFLEHEDLWRPTDKQLKTDLLVDLDPYEVFRYYWEGYKIDKPSKLTFSVESGSGRKFISNAAPEAFRRKTTPVYFQSDLIAFVTQENLELWIPPVPEYPDKEMELHAQCNLDGLIESVQLRWIDRNQEHPR